MKPSPSAGSSPEILGRPKTKRTQKMGAPSGKLSKRGSSVRKLTSSAPHSGKGRPADLSDASDLRHHIRLYAERETEALALKTVQLAKRGHSGALAFVFESITQTDKRQGAPLLADLGSITRLDEIADAQRLVITSAAEGHITPADAIHHMKILKELGEAIKNADLQAQIDELRSYVHGA